MGTNWKTGFLGSRPISRVKVDNKTLTNILLIDFYSGIWAGIPKTQAFNLCPFLTLIVRNGPSVRFGTNVPWFYSRVSHVILEQKYHSMSIEYWKMSIRKMLWIFYKCTLKKILFILLGSVIFCNFLNTWLILDIKMQGFFILFHTSYKHTQLFEKKYFQWFFFGGGGDFSRILMKIYP